MYLELVNDLWGSVQIKNAYSINWKVFATEEDLLRAYWKNPDQISLAILFEDPDPINGSLK